MGNVNLRSPVLKRLNARYGDTPLSISDQVLDLISKLEVYEQWMGSGVLPMTTNEEASTPELPTNESLLGQLQGLVHLTEN